jgi:hypothetical protein
MRTDDIPEEYITREQSYFFMEMSRMMRLNICFASLPPVQETARNPPERKESVLRT